MSNDKLALGGAGVPRELDGPAVYRYRDGVLERGRSSFVFCHSFVIRHSSFVIFLTANINVLQLEWL